MNKTSLNDHLGYLLTTTTKTLIAYMQRKVLEANIDVPFEQLRVLAFISMNEGVIQQSLCESLNKAKPGVSRLVDSLVKKELVEQRADDNDRRVKKIFITPKGMEVRNKFFPISVSNLSKIESQLGEKETKQIKQHLRAIKEILSNSLKEEE